MKPREKQNNLKVAIPKPLAASINGLEVVDLTDNDTSITIEKNIRCIKCRAKYLLIGYVKAGKTYKELQRMYEDKNAFSIIVTINSLASRNQTKQQALEIGYTEEQIFLPGDLKKQYNRYPNLKAKLLIVNLNENYDAKLCDIIAEAHNQGIRVNYTSDEYDMNAAVMMLKNKKPRHDIERRWMRALDEEDIYTCVSATNAVAFYSAIKWTEVKIITPWHPDYKGIEDIDIKTLDDLTVEELFINGIVGSSIINKIKAENNPRAKALIKITNRVNYDKDDVKTHEQLLEQFLKWGIKAVMMNSKSYPTDEEYDNAEVIIVGQMANRTKEFKDIYTQYLDFGVGLCDASIIQSLRCCGARPYTPKVYVSQTNLSRLEKSIEVERQIQNYPDWNSDKPRRLEISPENKPLPDKIAGQVREKYKQTPEAIISMEEYTGKLTELFPMVDEINYQETAGTRKYGDKTVDYVVNSVINACANTKARVQENRNLVIPNKKGVIPSKGTIATSIKMGIYYEKDMLCFASFYIDPDTYELKIALWRISEKEEKDIFYVKTEDRAAA